MLNCQNQQSLFTLYLAFLTQEAGHCKEGLTLLAGQLEEACSSGEKREISEKHKEMVEAVESMDIMERMDSLIDDTPTI